MATERINAQVPRASYGTAAPNHPDGEEQALARAASRRRQLMRWAATSLTVTGLVLIGYGYTRYATAPNNSTPPTMAVVGDGEAAEPVVGTDPEGPTIQCWQSSYIGNKQRMMEPIEDLEWVKTPGAMTLASVKVSSTISVDASRQYQEILGFGGAFTEAAALQFQRLPEAKREEVMRLYFDKEHGSAYEFGRVPMGSCDFSVSSYSFDDVANDTDLEHFDSTVAHDTKMLIPFIKRALDKNPQLKLFLAPWSPPAWMKRGDPAEKYVPSMLGSAIPNGLKEELQHTWALYFSKFISAYKQHGIPFWGLTPQNEPEFAAPWEACTYNAEFQADFVGHHLGPVIKRDHPGIKIMVFDHNRGSIALWAKTVYNHPTAKDYVDGIAFHWYANERENDGVQYHERLNDSHHANDQKFLLASESCNCPGVANGSDAWFRGQRYAHDIMADFNNWVSAWVDWNLLLDHLGGPNHQGNNCDAPIILDPSGRDFMIQPMYYFIQHFSKFVPPGSRRIHTDLAVRFAQPGDAQLFTHYPAELHACDGSSRQQIQVTDDQKLQIKGTPYCLDFVTPLWVGRQIEVVKCVYTSQQWTFDNGQIRMKDHCIQLNHGSTQNGVRIMVDDCVESGPAWHQKWQLQHGEMRSLAATDKCVTAGYAFVQSVAFETPDKKKVAVVLNENTEEAQFQLVDGDWTMDNTLPAGAIRTYVWE